MYTSESRSIRKALEHCKQVGERERKKKVSSPRSDPLLSKVSTYSRKADHHSSELWPCWVCVSNWRWRRLCAAVR